MRQAIRALEINRSPDNENEALPLGIPALDEALGGGVARATLHEIAAARESDMAAATAFVLALAARFSSPLPPPRRREEGGREPARAIVWIAEDMALAESGALYGPGIDEAGLFPERLITVRVPKHRNLAWVMEEALRCRAVGAVVGEWRNGRLDLVATRRLSLAAAHGGAPAFLLRAVQSAEPSAAATRSIVSSAAALSRAHGIGPPRLTLRLVRNRRGRLGSWMLEWNHAEQRFKAAAYPEPVAQAVFDRSPPAAAA